MIVRKRALDAIKDRLYDNLDVLRELQANPHITGTMLYDPSIDVRDDDSFKATVCLRERLDNLDRLFGRGKLAAELTYKGQIDAATYAITGDSVIIIAGESPYRTHVTKALDDLTKDPTNHLQRIGVGRYKQG